jgi:hypothetical protein
MRGPHVVNFLLDGRLNFLDALGVRLGISACSPRGLLWKRSTTRSSMGRDICSKEKPGARPGFVRLVFRLLGRGHFFGFAFLAHKFEFALGFFVGCLHFLLDLLGRFLELG